MIDVTLDARGVRVITIDNPARGNALAGADAVRALVGMPALPKAKDLPPIPSFEARMMSWGVK